MVYIKEFCYIANKICDNKVIKRGVNLLSLNMTINLVRLD